MANKKFDWSFGSICFALFVLFALSFPVYILVETLRFSARTLGVFWTVVSIGALVFYMISGSLLKADEGKEAADNFKTKEASFIKPLPKEPFRINWRRHFFYLLAVSIMAYLIYIVPVSIGWVRVMVVFVCLCTLVSWVDCRNRL